MIQLVKETKPNNVLSVKEWNDNGEIVVGITTQLDGAYILSEENGEFIFRDVVNNRCGANGWSPSRKELIDSLLRMGNMEVFVFNGVYSAMKFLREKMGEQLDKQSKMV